MIRYGDLKVFVDFTSDTETAATPPCKSLSSR